MRVVVDKAQSRGYANHGWLKTHHTFSFANYYNPERVHFGMLRVLNDDSVAPGEGFDMHPHKNMEVISIPLKGYLRHGDSIKNSEVITPGDIQVMSAGTGGTSATIGRYIRCQGYDTQLMVVDPQNSVFLDYWQNRNAELRSPVGSKIEGIGRPRVEPSFIPDVVDEMMRVPDAASVARPSESSCFAIDFAAITIGRTSASRSKDCKRCTATSSDGACQKAAVHRATSAKARRMTRAFHKITTQLATDMASSSRAVPCVTASPWRHQ